MVLILLPYNTVDIYVRITLRNQLNEVLSGYLIK